MLKGISLTELAQRIEANKADKRDFIVDTAAVEVVVAEPVNGKAPGTSLVIANQGSFPILPLAHNQIAARLNIPRIYYDRMLVEQPELLARNVNTWFKANPEKRMIRTLAGRERAFLSNRFARIENEEIAEAALPILAEQPGIEIKSAEVTERRMYIQAVSPTLQAEIKGSRRVGDVVQAGVMISNSEVGFGAATVADLDFFLACLNGMVSSKAFRQYHVGKRIEDDAELWADDTRRADDRAVLLKLRDMIRAAFDGQRFRQRIEKMENLVGIEIKSNPVAAVELLSVRIGATMEESNGILQSLIKGGDLSAWGLTNAVTAQAHTATSYDRAVEFEAMGGALLDLSRKDWSEVLEAEKVPVRRGRKTPVIDATFEVAA